MKQSIARAACAATALVALAAIPAQARGRDREPMVVTANQVVDMADARIAQFKADLRLTADQDKNWGGLQTALHDMALRRADRMAKMRDQRASDAASMTAPTAAPPVAPGTAATAPGTVSVAPATPAPVATAPVATAPVADTRMRDDRFRDDRRDARDDRGPDMIGEMRLRADALAVRSDDLKKVSDAAAPLYGSLDEGQRRRFAMSSRRCSRRAVAATCDNGPAHIPRYAVRTRSSFSSAGPLPDSVTTPFSST